MSATDFGPPTSTAQPLDAAVAERELHTCQQCRALCMQPATILTRLCCVCRGDPEHVGVHVQ